MNYLIEKYIGIKVAKVRNSIKNEMEIALMPYNITTTQFVVLVKLCEKDRMTQKDLANETNYKQSALTLILDKLESKELIIRETIFNISLFENYEGLGILNNNSGTLIFISLAIVLNNYFRKRGKK